MSKKDFIYCENSKFQMWDGDTWHGCDFSPNTCILADKIPEGYRAFYVQYDDSSLYYYGVHWHTFAINFLGTMIVREDSDFCKQFNEYCTIRNLQFA